MHNIYDTSYLERSRAELELALGVVPAYRSWRTRDPGPDAPVDVRFAALPTLDKQDLRQWGLEGFVAPGHDVRAALARGEIELAQTSGSTDERVTLAWNQAWWNASEAASWTLNAHAAAAGLGDHPEAILTSPLSTGVLSDKGPLPMSARRLARFLYLNEYADSRDWPDELVRRVRDELADFRPVVLEANPTMLARFARRARLMGLACHQPALIVLSFEWPSRLHLREIARVFHCPTLSSHGCTEAGCIFTQCEAGGFHQNSAFARVEVQPLAARHGRPGLARIFVSSFGNPWRVLLRFRVGDIVRLRDPVTPCACGRHLGIAVDAIEGRTKDLTFDTAGRAVTVGDLDAALAPVAGLVEYQVVQIRPDAWRAQVVTEGDDIRIRREVGEALRACYGAGAYAVERVEAIAPEVSGKHRLVWCEQPFDLADHFEGPVVAP